MKMQQLTNTNGHPRTLKPRPADAVFQENLLSKFRHLQDQVRELNGLLRQEKVQSKVRKNIITGLQQELRSATRQTKTQRAQKENSIHREKESKRQLERLIKINTGEMAVPGKNQIMFNKRYETKCGQGCLSEIKWQCAQWNVQISVLRTYGPNLTDTVNSSFFFFVKEPQAETEEKLTPASGKGRRKQQDWPHVLTLTTLLSHKLRINGILWFNILLYMQFTLILCLSTQVYFISMPLQ